MIEMYRVVSCLVTEHDTWLVLLAVIVCVATALTSFLMYSIADACSGPRKLLWAALTGVSAGSGIWATHFVAMLAYKGALPTHYEPVATIGSLLIAIVLAAVGFAVSTGRNRWWMALGGILIGFAIGTMHFTGMTALVIPGTIEWDSNVVVASWVLGCAIAATAMLAFHGRSGTQAIVCAGALLAAAICVLHFTAMGAVTVHFDPTVAFEGIGMNRAHLALVIAAVTFIVLLSAFAAAIVQRANLHYEAALQQQNSLFEAALRYLPVGFSMFDGEQRLIMQSGVQAALLSGGGGDARGNALLRHRLQVDAEESPRRYSLLGRPASAEARLRHHFHGNRTPRRRTQHLKEGRSHCRGGLGRCAGGHHRAPRAKCQDRLHGAA